MKKKGVLAKFPLQLTCRGHGIPEYQSWHEAMSPTTNWRRMGTGRGCRCAWSVVNKHSALGPQPRGSWTCRSPICSLRTTMDHECAGHWWLAWVNSRDTLTVSRGNSRMAGSVSWHINLDYRTFCESRWMAPPSSAPVSPSYSPCMFFQA